MMTITSSSISNRNSNNIIFKSRVLINLLLWLLLLMKQTNAQFIRDCNDPVIVGHVGGDTYCGHACGFFANPGQLGRPVCTSAGICVCQCEVDVPQASLATDLCPKSSDPADTDTTARARCASDCTAICVGGVSEVCGEQAPTTNAKICVCSCPPTGCPGSTPSTTTATPINTTTTNLVLIPIIKPHLIGLPLLLYFFLGFLLQRLALIVVTFVVTCGWLFLGGIIALGPTALQDLRDLTQSDS